MVCGLPGLSPKAMPTLLVLVHSDYNSYLVFLTKARDSMATESSRRGADLSDPLRTGVTGGIYPPSK